MKMDNNKNKNLKDNNIVPSNECSAIKLDDYAHANWKCFLETLNLVLTEDNIAVVRHFVP